MKLNFSNKSLRNAPNGKSRRSDRSKEFGSNELGSDEFGSNELVSVPAAEAETAAVVGSSAMTAEVGK